MSISVRVLAIAWKWPGAEVSEINGVLKWHPNSPIPRKYAPTIAAAVVEYEARDQSEEDYQRSVRKRAGALELVCAEQFGMTPAQMKVAIKAKM